MNQYEYEAGEELAKTAKNLMKSHGVTESQALRMAVAANPKLGHAYTGFRIGPGGFERVYRQRLRANAPRKDEFQLKIYSQGPEQTDDDSEVHAYDSVVDSVVSEAKRAVGAGGGDISLPNTVIQILRTRPSTAQKIAGNWLDHQARVEVNNRNLGSSLDSAYGVALRLVMNEHTAVRQMYETGRISLEAMRTIFHQWFRD